MSCIEIGATTTASGAEMIILVIPKEALHYANIIIKKIIKPKLSEDEICRVSVEKDDLGR